MTEPISLSELRRLRAPFAATESHRAFAKRHAAAMKMLFAAADSLLEISQAALGVQRLLVVTVSNAGFPELDSLTAALAKVRP